MFEVGECVYPMDNNPLVATFKTSYQQGMTTPNYGTRERNVKKQALNVEPNKLPIIILKLAGSTKVYTNPCNTL